jgi:MYXO-CTERM domain-containing protein
MTLYSPGIQWGWANFHISVPILNAIPALLQAFALDTSSLANFDVALDCLPVTSCPLNDFVTTSFLSGLDADFLATPVPAPVPEPQTWAMAVLGFAGLGLLGLRRKRDRHGCRIVAQQQQRTWPFE